MLSVRATWPVLLSNVYPVTKINWTPIGDNSRLLSRSFSHFWYNTFGRPLTSQIYTYIVYILIDRYIQHRYTKIHLLAIGVPAPGTPPPASNHTKNRPLAWTPMCWIRDMGTTWLDVIAANHLQFSYISKKKYDIQTMAVTPNRRQSLHGGKIESSCPQPARHVGITAKTLTWPLKVECAEGRRGGAAGRGLWPNRLFIKLIVVAIDDKSDLGNIIVIVLYGFVLFSKQP